jgi:hypothetical protein
MKKNFSHNKVTDKEPNMRTKIETFSSINEWQRKTFPSATIDGVLAHIKEEWQEFLDAPTITDHVEEAADLIILLACYIDKAHGVGAQMFVDYKMERNRKRSWNIQPDGTGRHVKESGSKTKELSK